MADRATIDVVRATREDGPALSRTLADAFQDDPVFQWVVADGEDRRARLPSVFDIFVDFYLPHEESYVAGAGVGAALWAPPGVEPIADEQLEEFGMRMEAVLGADAERAAQIDEIFEEHHPTAPCSYLQFMGVAPEHQGRGVGSRMLRTVLDRCDATGTPAYLEATSADNSRLYQRHGFEVVDEVTLPGGPPVWPMWRDPARA